MVVKQYRRLTLHSQHELIALRKALRHYDASATPYYLEDIDYLDTIKLLAERADRVKQFKDLRLKP